MVPYPPPPYPPKRPYDSSLGKRGPASSASFILQAGPCRRDFGAISGPYATYIWEFPKIRGTLFWGPFSQDPTILGYYIRVPYFSETSIYRP